MPRKKKVEDVTDDTSVDSEEEVVTEAMPTKQYLYPETKEEHLALLKLLNDMGIHSISVLENKISKL